MPLLTRPALEYVHSAEERRLLGACPTSEPGRTHHSFSYQVARQSLIDPALAEHVLNACDRGDLATLRVLVVDPALREAIEVASPSLGAQLDRFTAGTLGAHRKKRMVEALFRYGVRSRYRATPLGLFAGIGVVTVNSEGPGGPDRREIAIRRIIRPSASWCTALCATITEHDVALLDLRVTASRSVYSRRRELITLVSGPGAGSGYAMTRHVPLVRRLLDDCAGWRQTQDVVVLVAERTGCGLESATRFVLSMIRHGLLVTELAEVEVDITPWRKLLSIVGEHASSGIQRWSGWTELADDLRRLDELLRAAPRTSPVAVHGYRELRAAMNRLQADPDLHVDAVLLDPVPPVSLSPQAIYTACKALAMVSPVATNPVIPSVVRWFTERYSDSHTVRLPELFLPGSGFDVASAVARASAWRASESDEPPGWTSVLEPHQILGSDTEVDILPLLSKATLKAAADELPPAFAAFVRTALSSGSTRRFHLRNLSGGLHLLGRFGHLDDNLLDVLRRFVTIQEAYDGDSVRAEVRCACVGRSQNIAQRPLLRQVSIDFGPPTTGQDEFGRDLVSLPVDDLLVRIFDGEIQLFSERLCRRVVPSVSTAVVSHRCVFPLATFLTILSGQASQGRGWNWRALGNMRSLPRITVGDVVLAQRQWTIGLADVEALRRRAGPGTDGLELPRFLTAGSSENPLFVDTASRMGLDLLERQVARSRRGLAVQEAWAQQGRWDEPAADLPATELVIPFHRPPPAAAPGGRGRLFGRAVTAQVPRGAIPRYGPGSRWASTKIYGRPGRLDDLLSAIAPMIESAVAAGEVRRWFFVRYADPEHHLRLRFQGCPRKLWGGFVPELWRALSELDRYWDHAIADEYRPEVDRYGGPRGLLFAERLFNADSELAVRLGSVDDGDRVCTAALTMHRILLALGHSLPDRRGISAAAEKARATRHRVEAARIEAGRRSRMGTAALIEALGPALEFAGNDAVGKWTRRIACLGPAIRDIHETDPPTLSAITLSLLHMHCNRMFVDNQNFWEVVAYSLLRRAYDRQLINDRAPAAGRLDQGTG